MKALPVILTIVILAFYTGLLLSTTGCKTVVSNGVTNTVFDVQKATNAVSLAVPPIVKFVVAKYPQTKPYFASSGVAIQLLLDTGQLDPQSLNNALLLTGIGQLNQPEVLAAIDAIVALYQSFYGQVVANNLLQVPNLVPILTAVGNSVNQGLN